MSGPATLGDLTSFMQARVREVGKHFRRPDDDWIMLGIVQGPEGISILPLPNDLFASGRLKDGLAEVLRRAVVELGAYRYAVLLNTHVRMMPVDTDEQREAAEAYVNTIRTEKERVQHSPDAVEMLVLVVGDAEEEHLWTAKIERHAHRPPTLGRWEERAGEGATWEGRFVGLNEYMGLPR